MAENTFIPDGWMDTWLEIHGWNNHSFIPGGWMVTYLISKKIAFLFRNEKILINSVITVLEIEKKKNKQILMEIRLKKQKSQKKFGNPKKL